MKAAAPYELEGNPRVARLQEELACRDEIIVALQHVVRELRHDLENLRAEQRYAIFALDVPNSINGEALQPPRKVTDDDIALRLAG
jgi:hypothetical protein